MPKLEVGDKYVLEKDCGLLMRGEMVVVKISEEPNGPRDEYFVKIESVSRPTYDGWDLFRLGEEPEVVGRMEL